MDREISEPFLMDLPRTVPEDGGVGGRFNEENVAGVRRDSKEVSWSSASSLNSGVDALDAATTCPSPVVAGAATLSLLPPSAWVTLFNLELVKVLIILQLRTFYF